MSELHYIAKSSSVIKNKYFSSNRDALMYLQKSVKIKNGEEKDILL